MNSNGQPSAQPATAVGTGTANELICECRKRIQRRKLLDVLNIVAIVLLIIFILKNLKG